MIRISNALRVPSPVARWRVLRPRRQPLRGTFAWWLSRFADPYDLAAFKYALLGAILLAGALLGK